jgi:hypothetical protein
VAYALIVDDFQHMGGGRVTLGSAMAAADEVIEGAANDSGGEAPSEGNGAGFQTPTAAENDRALVELQRMMSGIT